jgi:hypothetical protein
VQAVDADQLDPQLGVGEAAQGEALAHDLAREPRPGDGVRAGVGDLPLADVAVEVAAADLVGGGARPGAGADHAHAIGGLFPEGDPADVQDAVRGDVASRVVDDVLGSYPTKAAEAAIALVEKTPDVVRGIAYAAGEVLSGLFGGRSSIESGFLSGVSGSPASAPVQLAVLFLFLSAVFWSGKLSWHRREPLKPSSALQLAIERPG